MLLVHCGELGAARAELRAYLKAVGAGPAAGAGAAGAGSGPPPQQPQTSPPRHHQPQQQQSGPASPASSGVHGGGGGGGGGGSREGGVAALELALCRRLMALLDGMGDSVQEPQPHGSGSGGGGGGGGVMSCGWVLAAPPPWERGDAPRAHKPLTW